MRLMSQVDPEWACLQALHFDSVSVLTSAEIRPTKNILPEPLTAHLRCIVPSPDNVRDNRAAGDVVIVGADKIAKLSAETFIGPCPSGFVFIALLSTVCRGNGIADSILMPGPW